MQLLSGKAPIVSLEQLAYDCRLMNAAAKMPGGARQLGTWLAASDAPLDVQAYILHPEVVLRLSEIIAAESEPYQQTLAAVRGAIAEIRHGIKDGLVNVADREVPWIDRLEEALDHMPTAEGGLIEQMLADPMVCKRFLPEEYGIDA